MIPFLININIVRQGIRTKFRLGKKRLTAINDGGLRITYMQNNVTSVWKYHNCPPVLGVEVYYSIFSLN